MKISPFPKFTVQEIISKIWLFHKTWLCCEFCQRFHWMGRFFTLFKGTISFVILTNKQMCPSWGLESVVSVFINKYSTITSYLTVSKGLIENQRRNCVLISLETEIHKNEGKNWHPLFSKIYLLWYTLCLCVCIIFVFLVFTFMYLKKVKRPVNKTVEFLVKQRRFLFLSYE